MEELKRALRERGRVRDADFDSVYPFAYQQHVSARFWTPVDTARRATDLLVGEGARQILDVGAGVGKFCLVGAATTRAARFTGVEQRPYLVQVAQNAKQQLGLERAEFLHAQLCDIEVSAYDGFYFFNPFAENIFAGTTWLDDRVQLSSERYHADVALARSLLAAAPPRTPVVTYCGYGGAMPLSYDLVHAERRDGSALELWIQSEAA